MSYSVKKTSFLLNLLKVVLKCQFLVLPEQSRVRIGTSYSSVKYSPTGNKSAQCPFNEYLRRLLHLFIHFILGEGRHEAGEADVEDGLDAVAAREAGHAQPRPARAVLHVQGQPLRRRQLQEAQQWDRD